MKASFGVTLVAIAIFLGGCASISQPSVQLGQDTLAAQTSRIGVAMTALPKVDTQLPGAGCLLCLAAASIANSSLTTHAHNLPYEDLPKLKNDVADSIRKKGTDVMLIAEDINIDALPNYDTEGPNIARKDFSSLQKKYKIDKLLVINITALGFLRTYSSYIPTSDPKALLQGTGYIVNLNNNTYEWYLPVKVIKSAENRWDEAPEFPGLTNAYFQALEIGKESFLKPFSN
jgi:hypothetical protein